MTDYILIHTKDEDTLRVTGYTLNESLEALLVAVRSLPRNKQEKLKYLQRQILNECLK